MVDSICINRRRLGGRQIALREWQTCELHLYSTIPRVLYSLRRLRGLRFSRQLYVDSRTMASICARVHCWMAFLTTARLARRVKQRQTPEEPATTRTRTRCVRCRNSLVSAVWLADVLFFTLAEAREGPSGRSTSVTPAAAATDALHSALPTQSLALRCSCCSLGFARTVYRRSGSRLCPHALARRRSAVLIRARSVRPSCTPLTAAS